MKILITGAAGFIGMHAALVLLARGEEVVGIDNLNDYYDPKLKLARLERLKPYADDYAFASDGYSNAVTFGYNARRRFSVFGEASSHARHDDILTDYRALAGRNTTGVRGLIRLNNSEDCFLILGRGGDGLFGAFTGGI